MADTATMTPGDQRNTLVNLLVQRGYTQAGAEDHVAWLHTDSAVRDDLIFHLREDEAIKRGAPLQPYEIVAHYTGPQHRLSTADAEDFARGDLATDPHDAPPTQEPGGVSVSSLLTPRVIVPALLAAVGLGLFSYSASRTFWAPEEAKVRRGR